MAETVLARLDGSTFHAPTPRGNALSQALQRWGRGISGAAGVRLVVQLDPPDSESVWRLRTLVSGSKGKVSRVDAAMSSASNARREAIKRELERLETLFEPLLRSKGKRRGEVRRAGPTTQLLPRHAGPKGKGAVELFQGRDREGGSFDAHRAVPSFEVCVQWKIPRFSGSVTRGGAFTGECR